MAKVEIHIQFSCVLTNATNPDAFGAYNMFEVHKYTWTVHINENGRHTMNMQSIHAITLT
jgi:hypothetical protein